MDQRSQHKTWYTEPDRGISNELIGTGNDFLNSTSACTKINN